MWATSPELRSFYLRETFPNILLCSVKHFAATSQMYTFSACLSQLQLKPGLYFMDDYSMALQMKESDFHI